MSDRHPFKRCKLDENKIVRECSDTFESLDKNVHGDDGIEMPTLHRENLNSRDPEANEDDEDDEVKMPTLEGNEDDEEEDGVEIPTLVVEIFLDWIKDVKLLKTCRLVNKYWNSLACSSLQINSIAKFDFERLKELIEFQESISSRDLSSRPSPFKIVHMITDELINESFLKLTKIPNIKVTSIKTFPTYKDISCSKRLNQLLKTRMKDLTDLAIRFECYHVSQIFQNIKLVALQSLWIKSLNIISRSSACNCLESLNSALEYTRLQKLVLPPDVLHSAFCSLNMLTINLSSIVLLALHDDEKYNVWDLFPQLLQLPALKTFSFRSFAVKNECKEKQLNVFLKSVASTLNELNIQWYRIEPDSSLIFRGVVFPQLKFLNVYCPQDISSFVTQGRFPSLKSLFIYVYKIHQMQFLSDGSDSLSTVRKISFKIDVNVEWQVLPNTPFPAWMLNLANIFPHTESLEIVFSSHSFSLLDISRAYPNLKFLRIDSLTRDWFLYGTCKIGQKTYKCRRRKTKGPNKHIPVEPSLLDFTKLKSLDLVGIEISTEAFQHCLPRMTALEELTFTYQPGPSVDVLADSLKHVRRIKMETQSYCLPNVTELQAALPGCEIIVD